MSDPRRARAIRALDSEVDPRELRLFHSLDVENRGKVRVGDLLEVFERVGLQAEDRRIAETGRALGENGLRDELDFAAFCEAVRPDILNWEFEEDRKLVSRRVLSIKGADLSALTEATRSPQCAAVEGKRFVGGKPADGSGSGRGFSRVAH